MSPIDGLIGSKHIGSKPTAYHLSGASDPPRHEHKNTVIRHVVLKAITGRDGNDQKKERQLTVLESNLGNMIDGTSANATVNQVESIWSTPRENQ